MTWLWRISVNWRLICIRTHALKLEKCRTQLSPAATSWRPSRKTFTASIGRVQRLATIVSIGTCCRKATYSIAISQLERKMMNQMTRWLLRRKLKRRELTCHRMVWRLWRLNHSWSGRRTVLSANKRSWSRELPRKRPRVAVTRPRWISCQVALYSSTIPTCSRMMQMLQTIQFSMRIIAEMRVVQHNSARQQTMRKKNKGRKRRANRRLATITKRRRKRLKSMLNCLQTKVMQWTRTSTLTDRLPEPAVSSWPPKCTLTCRSLCTLFLAHYKLLAKGKIDN